MKKILTGIMIFTLLITSVGCSSSNSTQENENTNQKEQTEETKSNILIAYFSKTGNTEEIANEIQTLTDGTLVEIVPTTAYPESYQETVDIASDELANNARPEIEAMSVDVEDYDTIFIGYPIWWHDAPMVIYTFLESYDLSGKTIVPFCTSGGSSIDESLPGITSAVDGATVLDGLTANSSSDVEAWLETIGILGG